MGQPVLGPWPGPDVAPLTLLPTSCPGRRCLEGVALDDAESVSRALAALAAPARASRSALQFAPASHDVGSSAGTVPDPCPGLQKYVPLKGTDVTVGGQGSSLATYFGLYAM